MNIFKKKEYSKQQLKIMATLRKLLEDERSQITITQDESCINNSDNNLYLFISDNFVQIANDSSFYKEEVPLHFSEKLKEMMVNNRKNILEKIKKEVFKNKTYLLSNIFREL